VAHARPLRADRGGFTRARRPRAPGGDPTRAHPPARAPTGTPTMKGRTLCGRYRVVDKLGEGGMGVVYEAFDEVLRIPVAVKVLHPDTRADWTARQRFALEALLLAPIDHPNVVRVTNYCEDKGELCIVMDLVPGTTLDKVIEGGALPEDEAVKL